VCPSICWAIVYCDAALFIVSDFWNIFEMICCAALKVMLKAMSMDENPGQAQ
jgi:hypothetical protein